MSIIYEPKGRALEYSHLACNLYNGCVHGCQYCYGPGVMHMARADFHKAAVPRKGFIEQLIREARGVAGTKKRVLLCFTCDPYPPVNMEQGMTRQTILTLRSYGIPFQILTKAGIRAVRDFDLYGPDDAFATTLTYLADDGKTLEVEPGAALPSGRIEAIRQAKDRGITTWVSLEPVLDPDESLEIIRRTHEIVDLYKIGKLNHRKSETDWRAFGQRAIELCEKYDRPYYVKADLAAYLEGIDYCSTDTRTVGEHI